MAKAATKPRFVSFNEAFTNFLKGYITWSGRATRAEYWWIFLFNVVATFIMRNFLPESALLILSTAWSIVMFLPLMSLAIRRLHDTNKSAYWYLGSFGVMFAGVWLMVLGKDTGMGMLGLVVMLAAIIAVITLMLLPSTPGKNRYGDIKK